MKKIIIISSTILLLLLAGIFAYFKGKQYEVVITQQQIDETLSKNFPITKSALLIFKLTYSNPQAVLLSKDDRIQVSLDAQLNIKLNDELKNLGGTITVTSGLRYEQETHSFYLTDTELNNLDIDGIPSKYEDKVKLLTSNYAREHLEKRPIYKLKATDTKKAAAKMLLKDMQVKDSEVLITLGL